MKKDVLINIVGKQTNECGETDTQEFVTAGKFYRKDDAYYIIYNESEVTGMEGTTTSLKIQHGLVTLNRMGKNEQKMIFQPGVQHKSQYGTPYGLMQIAVISSVVEVDLTDTGGSINLEYELEVENRKISYNILSLAVREA